MYLFLNMGNGINSKNVDILTKGANGISRGKVTANINGLTGSAGLVQSEEDADKMAILKEDMAIVYNTAVCGIINKSA